jgi:hypothetical protein
LPLEIWIAWGSTSDAASPFEVHIDTAPGH